MRDRCIFSWERGCARARRLEAKRRANARACCGKQIKKTRTRQHRRLQISFARARRDRIDGPLGARRLYASYFPCHEAAALFLARRRYARAFAEQTALGRECRPNEQVARPHTTRVKRAPEAALVAAADVGGRLPRRPIKHTRAQLSTPRADRHFSQQLFTILGNDQANNECGK